MNLADELTSLADGVLLRPRSATLQEKRERPAPQSFPQSAFVRSVTHAELYILNDPDPDGSGYAGVYPKDADDPTPLFLAKAFKVRISPYCERPGEAARYAVAWWKMIYGDEWPAIYRARKIEAGRCVRDAEGGFRFLVRVARTPGLPTRHPPGLWYLKGTRTTAARSRTPDYETKPQAREDYLKWAESTFGGTSHLYLRSTEVPKPQAVDPPRSAGSPKRRKMTVG